MTPTVSIRKICSSNLCNKNISNDLEVLFFLFLQLVDAAVKSAYSLFENAGQTCTAPSRVFVQAGVYDEFVKKATAIAAATKVADSFTPGAQQGPQVRGWILAYRFRNPRSHNIHIYLTFGLNSLFQIDLESFRKILGLIESGISEGAKLQTGGARIGSTGFFIQPTVFSDVKDNMKIAKEEVSG